MIDIVIPPIYGTSKFDRGRRNQKNIVLKGRIVSIRRARQKISPKRPRKRDNPNSKAFIIIVDYDSKVDKLINRRVEIRVI